MQISTIEITTRVLNDANQLQEQHKIVRYLLIPDSGKLLKNKQTGQIFAKRIQIGHISFKDLFEEIDDTKTSI
jgi:hypothetical protein